MACYEIDLPSGGTAHVHVADDIGVESMQAVFAVVEAAEAVLASGCMAPHCGTACAACPLEALDDAV